MRTRLLGAGAALAALAALASSGAGAAPAYTPTNADGQIEMVLKDHAFTPAEIHVPANKRTQILLKNQDATAEEFDSTDLKVEKVIAGNGEGVVRLRALDPGKYSFMGEYHPTTAKGIVVAE